MAADGAHLLWNACKVAILEVRYLRSPVCTLIQYCNWPPTVAAYTCTQLVSAEYMTPTIQLQSTEHSSATSYIYIGINYIPSNNVVM